MDRASWLLLFLTDPQRRGQPVKALEPLRIMKGMFLVSQRGKGDLSDLYEFHAYDYGPFTADVYRDLDDLALAGLVAQEAMPGRSWRTYRPTIDGLDLSARLAERVSHDDLSTLTNAYQFVETRGFLPLLRDIYAEYPEYAVNTVVKDAAPRR